LENHLIRSILYLIFSTDERRDLDAGASRVSADHDGDRPAEVGGPDQVPEKRSALFNAAG